MKLKRRMVAWNDMSTVIRWQHRLKGMTWHAGNVVQEWAPEKLSTFFCEVKCRRQTECWQRETPEGNTYIGRWVAVAKWLRHWTQDPEVVDSNHSSGINLLPFLPRVAGSVSGPLDGMKKQGPECARSRTYGNRKTLSWQYSVEIPSTSGNN